MMTCSENRNHMWLKAKFQNDIEMRVKEHRQISPDDVDFLIEYYEAIAEAGKDEEVAAAYDEGVELGQDEAKNTISGELDECIELYQKTKSACLNVISGLIDQVLSHQLGIPHQHRIEHIKSLLEDVRHASGSVKVLTYICEADQKLANDYEGEICFEEIEHEFHRVL